MSLDSVEDGRTPSQSTKMKTLIAVFSVIIALTLAAIIIYVVLYVVAKDVDNVYAVMIDAGSTSSKFALFYWSDWPFRTTGFVREKNYSTLKPGISSYGPNPQDGANLVVKSLTEMTEYNIPLIKSKTIHVYLGATAGMRLLEHTEPTQAVGVMQTLRTTLSGSGYNVKDPQKDVRIISGSDEGLFGWISVNYLLRNFGDEEGNPPKPAYDQMGSIDLGGASTQIAFIPADGVTGQNIVKQSVFGNTYDVYSYSFLCYGKEASQKRYYAELIVKAPGMAIVQSPCHMSGFTTTIKADAVFTKPCVLGNENLIGPELPKPAGTPVDITIQGTGKPLECETILKGFFRKAECTHGTCSFNNVFQPTPRGNFYGISALYFAMSFLRPSTTQIITTRTDLHAATFQLCSTPWADIEAKYSASQLPFISDYCFSGIYAEYLIDGYGFTTDEQWKTIEFVQKVNGDTATWAIGYMLDASGKIASLEPKIALGTIAFAVGLALFLLVLAISLGACLFILLRK